jgi:hypothetical protein
VKLRGVAAILGAVILGSLSLRAQTNASVGPVHLPAGYSTNAAPVAPLPVPLPQNNVAPSIVPTAPAPSAPASGADEDIHDIRGPIAVPNALDWVYEIAAALVLLALAYAAWCFFRRGPKPRSKLPHEIALDRLEAARSLMTEARVREYAFAVSEAVRLYIEQRFGERAARRTTEEFISDLLRQTNTPLARHRALLEDFLHHCDLPKFARWQLSVREMESMHESARAFILNTQPNATLEPSIAPTNVPAPVPAR